MTDIRGDGGASYLVTRTGEVEVDGYKWKHFAHTLDNVANAINCDRAAQLRLAQAKEAAGEPVPQPVDRKPWMYDTRTTAYCSGCRRETVRHHADCPNNVVGPKPKLYEVTYSIDDEVVGSTLVEAAGPVVALADVMADGGDGWNVVLGHDADGNPAILDGDTFDPADLEGWKVTEATDVPTEAQKQAIKDAVFGIYEATTVRELVEVLDRAGMALLGHRDACSRMGTRTFADEVEYLKSLGGLHYEMGALFAIAAGPCKRLAGGR